MFAIFEIECRYSASIERLKINTRVTRLEAAEFVFSKYVKYESEKKKKGRRRAKLSAAKLSLARHARILQHVYCVPREQDVRLEIDARHFVVSLTNRDFINGILLESFFPFSARYLFSVQPAR